MKIAIVGTGIAGNVVAHRLHPRHDITVFEAGDHVGGHTHTHSIELSGERHEIDTGFIVFNDWTYPNFIALLDELKVPSQPSVMSFSVRNECTGLEYNGTTLNTLFAQRRNLFRPAFHRMVRDILRFNREAVAFLEGTSGMSPGASFEQGAEMTLGAFFERGAEMTLGAFLEEGRYSSELTRDYLIPMGAAIWSTDPRRMLDFPARFFLRFFYNHGMLSIDRRPQWRAIRGGSARYVEKLVAPFRDRIRLRTPVQWIRRLADGVLVKAPDSPPERYDQVFIACHSDQALRLLADASALEREILGAIPYQENDVVLHTDATLLPRARRAWAAWNYHVVDPATQPVAVTYNMNILQSLAARETFCVTLNRTDRIDPRRILKRLVYHHPLYTPAGVAAQQRQGEVNGVDRTYFCGAYWRFGFHEDGVVSALEALKHFDARAHEQRDLSRVA